MNFKPLTSLVAGALLVASSAAVAQSATPPAPEPAIERVGEGDALVDGNQVATTLGILFALFVIVVLIWGEKDEGPLSP